jgi:hypothetical protein
MSCIMTKYYSVIGNIIHVTKWVNLKNMVKDAFYKEYIPSDFIYIKSEDRQINIW